MALMRTRLALICLVLYLLTMTLYILGFAMPYWVTEDFGYTRHFGLWQHCATMEGDTEKTCDYLLNRDNKAYFRAAEAFMTMSLMCSVPAGVLIVLWIKFSDQRRWGLLSSIGNALAGGLAIIGLIIFGAEYKRRGSRIHPNGWAFWITIMGSALLLLQGIVWTVIVLIPGLGFHYEKERGRNRSMEESRPMSHPPRQSHHPAGLY